MGFVDVKSSPVHFYVHRRSQFNTSSNDDFQKIPFQVERLNIGGAMNLRSGVFTAPKAGIYEFSFVGWGVGIDKGIPSTGFAATHLTLNDDRIAVASSRVSNATDGYLTITLHSTLNLKEGDKIILTTYPSSVLHDDHTFNTNFSGSLLEENLTF